MEVVLAGGMARVGVDRTALICGGGARMLCGVYGD